MYTVFLEDIVMIEKCKHGLGKETCSLCLGRKPSTNKQKTGAAGRIHDICTEFLTNENRILGISGHWMGRLDRYSGTRDIPHDPKPKEVEEES